MAPQYLISQSESKVILRNYEGVISAYNEPTTRNGCQDCGECPRLRYREQVGLAKLFAETKIALVPQGNIREKRRRSYC